MRPGTGRRAIELITALGAGTLLGAVPPLSRQLPTEWARIVILVSITPTVALLVKDMDKLLLITLVTDIPLGLDIALANKPGHTGGPGGFFISLMTIALAVGYARWSLKKQPDTRLFAHRRIAVAALVFLCATLLSALQATQVWFTITQLFLTLQFVLMYFYLINHVRSWADVRLLVTTLAACLLLESVLIILQFYGGLGLSARGIEGPTSGRSVAGASSRVAGTFAGPNVAATFLAASLAITLAAFLVDNRLVNKRLAFAATFLGAVALVITRSRGAWLAAAVALSIITVKALRSGVGRKTVPVLLGVTLILGIGLSGLVVERLTRDDRNSAQSRLWYSELAFNVIQEHMLMGVGANNQRFVLDDEAYVPSEMLGQERTAIHNTYLAMWVELGLPGFVTFVWLLVAGASLALSISRRTRDRYVSVIISGFLGALTVNALHMTVASFTGRRMQFLWFVLALIGVTARLASGSQELEGRVHQLIPAGAASPASVLDGLTLHSSER
ncbi:MAG: O-antigen ligase family protein [bacterium]